MSSINLKLLIIAVVTISLLLIAGSLLISTLNPAKTSPSPSLSLSLSPSPTVNTSQSTNEPTNVQETPAPAAIQPAGGKSPATAESGSTTGVPTNNSSSGTTPAAGTEPKNAFSPKPVRIP